jgi:hypothetical protein
VWIKFTFLLDSTPIQSFSLQPKSKPPMKRIFFYQNRLDIQAVDINDKNEIVLIHPKQDKVTFLTNKIVVNANLGETLEVRTKQNKAISHTIYKINAILPLN